MDDDNKSTVTVFREHDGSEGGVRFLTVVIDRDTMEVEAAIDEDGVPIALTPEEEVFAVRMVESGWDETGK